MTTAAIIRSSAIAALALALAGCSSSRSVNANVNSAKADESSVDAKDRKMAPDFSLKDATGATVKLSDLKGKVVLLNFWATWCGPCKVEIPWFIEFQQTYKDRNFTVLGVSFDDDGWTSVKPYVAEKKINYQVVVGDDKMAKMYGGVESLPTTFVIDRSGRIASTHVGLIAKKQYVEEIQKLLETSAKNEAAPSPVHDLVAAAFRIAR